MIVAPAPWEADPQAFSPRPWGPHDDLLLTEHLQIEGIPVKGSTAAQAVELVARESSYHPVIDYLDSLEWDRRPRLNGWMSKYLGAQETPYTETVGRAALIGAVARIRNP